ncbi:MAG: glycosyltransferase family 1 protein [Bryobacteraceae bacterium]|jgi:alpha-1,3-rhamnosyl/mannosyltransferase
MRVLVDATPLLVRSAGVKNYLYHWIEHLRRAAGPGESIRTFPALDERVSLEHDRSVAGFWRTHWTLAALAASNYTPAPVMDWVGRDADIFHASSLTGKTPRRARLTITIHDLTSWLMPGLHPAANRRADENLAALARRAHRVIAVSECTRQDAVRVLSIAAEKIEVIHSGVAESFFHVEEAAVEAVRARYSLVKPFILSVGTIEPRKNTDALLSAWQALPHSLREEFDLVLAGPIGWAPASTMERVRRVRYLGYVPEADIAPLTAAATVFAYPSLYEGFGFPVAQAMAAGVPVITSNVSSLPEIAGDAAVLIDPRSLAELRDGLSRLLLSPHVRAELAARGRQRAALFQWQTCAEQSLRFFRAVAMGSY